MSKIYRRSSDGAAAENAEPFCHKGIKHLFQLSCPSDIALVTSSNSNTGSDRTKPIHRGFQRSAETSFSSFKANRDGQLIFYC